MAIPPLRPIRKIGFGDECRFGFVDIVGFVYIDRDTFVKTGLEFFLCFKDCRFKGDLEGI